MDVNTISGLIDILDNTRSIEDAFKRRFIAAAVITQAFKIKGHEPPIVVGGFAVETYTHGNYATIDIDFISKSGGREYEIVEELGFKRNGKDLYSKYNDIVTEFPTGPLAGKDSMVFVVNEEITGLPVYIIGLEDLIIDRLNSYFSTNDSNSYMWASVLMISSYKYLDFSYFQKRCYEEGIGDKAIRFQRTMKWQYRNSLLKNREDAPSISTVDVKANTTLKIDWSK